MTESIIVAIITGAFAVVGNILSNKKNHDLIEYRMSEMEKKLDEVDSKLLIHNGYAEKFANITTDIKLIQKDIENLNNEK